MELGKTGWLRALLDEAVAQCALPEAATPASSAAVSTQPAAATEVTSVGGAGLLPTGRARARAYLRRCLRESGLLYGTPRDGSEDVGGRRRGPEEVLFLAVVRTLARIGLDIAALQNSTAEERRDRLLSVFAVLVNHLDDAAEIQRKVARREPVSKRTWSRIESALEQRAVSLSGDPAFGLLLHNGALYADAQLFGRQAIDTFARPDFSRAAAIRRLNFAAKQKALLVEVLTALSCAERPPNFAARRAILRQVEDLQLPSPLNGALRDAVKKAFERPRSLATIVRDVRSVDVRHFVIEQTLLATLVDGRRSEREVDFVRELAQAVRISPEELGRLELEMAEFYAKHRDVVDVFTVSEGATRAGEELVDGIAETLEKNLQRLMKEVRETGELSVLLTRAARGQSLSADERKRMRAQLIDVAKVIPALAIFAAPGGVLLLIALAKVLKINLLPSAFQEEDEETGELDRLDEPPQGTRLG